MHQLRRVLAASAVTLAATGCTRAAGGTRHEPSGDAGITSKGGHTVIEREALARSDVPILDLLRYRVPGMEVNPTSDCPEVIFRGKSTIVTNSSAAVYVDGERAVNTCVLSMLSTFHIARVEVYPGGVPPSGYLADPYGVILIYSMKGREPD